MKRYGMVIQIKPNKIEEYKHLHQHVWSDLLAILSKYHIKNYSIFLKNNWLFGYLEYHGNNYTDDMKKIANEEVTKRWWQLTAPCQEPLSTSEPDEWWSLMQEVFHLE